MAEFKNELILQVVDSSGAVTKSVAVDLRNALVLTSAPTTATAARVGMQAYVVSGSTVNSEYVCVAAENGVYTWVRRVVESSGGGTGITPHIGENGNWFIGDTDTGVRAEGITPHIGENGNWFLGDTDTGVRAEGITPHIGENGNWFLGDTDTGVKAQGSDYILTEADKTEIAEEAAALVDAALLNLIGEVE